MTKKIWKREIEITHSEIVNQKAWVKAFFSNSIGSLGIGVSHLHPREFLGKIRERDEY